MAVAETEIVNQVFCLLLQIAEDRSDIPPTYEEATELPVMSRHGYGLSELQVSSDTREMMANFARYEREKNERRLQNTSQAGNDSNTIVQSDQVGIMVPYMSAIKGGIWYSPLSYYSATGHIKISVHRLRIPMCMRTLRS